MTEDEAKTKWCPVARVLGAEPGAGNRHVLRDGELNGANLCIGSACMAWRWAKVPNPEWKPRHTMMAGYPVNPYSETPPHAFSSTDGYCGLAGQQ